MPGLMDRIRVGMNGQQPGQMQGGGAMPQGEMPTGGEQEGEETNPLAGISPEAVDAMDEQQAKDLLKQAIMAAPME